jgi:cell division protein FtsB
VEKQQKAKSNVRQLANLPTGRGVILGITLLVIVASMAVPARTLLQQQLEIAQLERENTQMLAEVEALREQVVRWNDQAYVIAQARERLHLVMPGEIAYVVLDPKEELEQSAKTQFVAAEAITTNPWYANLWQSAVIAGLGDAPAGGKLPTTLPAESTN